MANETPKSSWILATFLILLYEIEGDVSVPQTIRLLESAICNRQYVSTKSRVNDIDESM